MAKSCRISVVGAGAWGTALALNAARAGHEVRLIGRDARRMADMNRSRENTSALPGINLPAVISVSATIEDISEADVVILAVPAQATREMLPSLQRRIRTDAVLVLTAKGFEQQTALRLSDVVSEFLPQTTLAVLSGPSFASDVGRGLPTAVTLASARLPVAERMAKMLAHAGFRLYASDDVIGVEMGGALKNVLSIACGIVEGRALGASARAALITRGFAELQRFAVAHGARSETLHGLSGLGDLILTCSSPQSRNFAYGMALGAGRPATGGKLSEGRFTARAVIEMATDKGIEMPICSAVAAIIDGEMLVNQAIEALMARPLRPETG
jgi:glycerol-3-phosphate dehydrogenase (NAD(P)+)